jgi:electron transfer flavoprotein alpha subunit
METILLLLHTESDGTLAPSAREAVTKALDLRRQLNAAPLAIGLVGGEVQAAANSLAECSATRWLSVSGADFLAARYATDALASEALCRAAQASLVLAPGTSRWLRCLPGVAARFQGRVDTHVTGLELREGRLTATRWYYRQRMEADLQRTHRPWFIALDPGCCPAWVGAAQEVRLEPLTVQPSAEHLRTQVKGFRSPPADAQTLRPDARLLLVAGAGWTKKQADGQTHADQAELLIRDFLQLTRASLGSSKSLVDLGGEGQKILPFLSHLNQVGQTGSTPRHPKGLATCCHGEEPHTVGWRFIGDRRAVNLDPNCGWARGKADVLYVGDAFQVMAKLNALLARRADTRVQGGN